MNKEVLLVSLHVCCYAFHKNFSGPEFLFLFFADSIENNVENVNENVQLGRQELASASQYQTKLRKKKLYLLLLLIVVLIILIGIIAWSAS